MGQNNDAREHGDKQGQQGGQMDKKNLQDQQRQQSNRDSDKDRSANPVQSDKGTTGSGNQNR